MKQLTAGDVRASFVTTPLRERNAITLPTDFDTLVWKDPDYLGWIDPNLPTVGYVVSYVDDGPTGIMLRQSDGRTRSRAQCSWCEDVTVPNDVHCFTARGSGSAGWAGNTVSTLKCACFECSANGRKLPPLAHTRFDREGARVKLIESLELRSGRFVADLRHYA